LAVGLEEMMRADPLPPDPTQTLQASSVWEALKEEA